MGSKEGEVRLVDVGRGRARCRPLTDTRLAQVRGSGRRGGLLWRKETHGHVTGTIGRVTVTREGVRAGAPGREAYGGAALVLGFLLLVHVANLSTKKSRHLVSAETSSGSTAGNIPTRT